MSPRPPSNDGQITVGGWFDAGVAVQIAATPAAGFRFTGFTGDLGGTTNPQSLTMDGPKTVTANFVPAILPQEPLFITGAPGSAAYATSFTVDTAGGSGTGAVTFSASGSIWPGPTLPTTRRGLRSSNPPTA